MDSTNNLRYQYFKYHTNEAGQRKQTLYNKN